ncbi:MAG: YfhO family protein [Bacteroidota bacterium]
MKIEKKKAIKKVNKKINLKNPENSGIKVLPINTWILLISILLIGIISFYNFLTIDLLFFFKDIGSDSINQDLPYNFHKFNILSEGFFSQWSFFSGMGGQYTEIIPTDPLTLVQKVVFYIGSGVFGIDYLIDSRFLRLFIYHFILSGLFFYYYLRTISTEKLSALIGSLLIAFSGYIVVGSSWGFSGHVFKAVFLLFAFEQLYVKKRWYFFPFAVIFLSHNPFILFIYSLFLLIYSLFRYFSLDKTSIIGFIKLSGKMIMWGTIGILMNFINFYAAFQKMFFSPRVSGSASYSQALSAGQDVVEQSSIVPTTILRLFSSDILGSGSNFQGWSNYFEAPLFYIGLLTLLIFPQIFIYLDKRKKIIFGSFLGFWVLTLVFPYLRHAMLAFTGDYFRFGFDFFIPFTLLFYAIYALNELDKTFKINYKLLGATLVILLVALFFPYKSIPLKAIDNSLRMSIVIILFLYSALLVLMSKPKYKSYAQIGLILLLTIELSYFSYKSYADREPVTKKEFTENAGGYKDGTIKAVNYIKSNDKTPFYRTEKDYQSGNAMHGSLNDAMAQGYYGTTSYSSFNQLNYVRFLEETGLIQKGDETATRWVTGFRGNPLLQTFGNVKYHLSKSEKPDMLRFGFDSLSRQAGISILKNRFYLPFGYTYDKFIDFEDYQKLITFKLTQQSLINIQQEFDRIGQTNIGNNVVNNLNKLQNKEFQSNTEFILAIEPLVGKEITNQFQFTFLKHSVNNFSNQLVLLNGFVYEEADALKSEIQEFKEIAPSDTSIFIPPTQFNLLKYGEIVNELRADTFQIVEFSQANIKGNIELSKTKMLFFTIPFDKGWKIKVNGEDKALSRVNIGFTGIVLPKGKHNIELNYVPQYSQVTSAISIVSIILFWLFLGYDVYRKRKLKKHNLQ